MTYRIAFRFEPRRGFWRVVKSFEVDIDHAPVFTFEGLLYVLATKPAVIGSYRSPKKALYEWMDNERK